MMIHWVGIGEVKVAHHGEKLAAILGSCISIVLWHPASRTTLMNHVLLPTRPTNRHDDNPGRYADESWQLMRKHLAAERIALSECVCHVVGGGKDKQLESDVGHRNISRVIDILFYHRVWIESMDSGGRCYRVVKFDGASGELKVSRHRDAPAEQIAGRESCDYS